MTRLQKLGRPRSVHGLFWRQIRVSTAVMAVLIIAAIKTGVAAYRVSGGATGLEGVDALLKNPGIQALYGRASTLGSAGAFTAWKLGMFLALAAAMWSALLATRLTRASEDDGTWDLLVVTAEGRRSTLAGAVVVLVEATTLTGVVTYVMLALSSQREVDCVLYGLVIAGVAWFGAGVGLVASQVVAPRRSASQWALGVIGVLFLVRMIADASRAGGWLRVVTPFGWLEDVGAFQHRSPGWLAPMLLVPAALAVVAVGSERARDVGGSLVHRDDAATARTRLLSSPWRFAWRERRSTLVTWAAGLALLGVTIGYLTHALVDFTKSDTSFLKLLDRWGYGTAVTANGFVATICAFIAVAVGFLVITLVSTVGNDERSGRLDMVFSFGAARTTWLESSIVAAALGTLLVAFVCGVFTWLGVEASGTSMSLWNPIRGMVNAASPALLLIGLAALLVVTVRRLAYPVMAAYVTLGYLDAALGPTLRWPNWLVDCSVFHYVALVPAAAPDWNATAVFLGAGIVLVGVSLWRFARKDVIS